MNYYDILKVSKTASQQEIRDSYKKLIKQYHPDIYKGNHEYAEKTTKELNDAYKVLSNEDSRREYDLSLIEQTQVPQYSPPVYSTKASNLDYEEPPKETLEQIMKKRIHKIVDEQSEKMSPKSKALTIILIILFALLFTMLSILDFLRIMAI